MRKILLVPALLSALITLGTTGLAADFDGDGREDVAVFRPSNGQWTIRGFTRMYFGTSADSPFAGDFDGDGIADPAYHRESNGLWKAKGITQFYFGNAGLGDERVRGGSSGQRTYDYVVKPGNGNDLLAALESDVYDSVFIPNGTYNVYTSINVDNVRRITGESMTGVFIHFGTNNYLSIDKNYCHIDQLTVQYGGGTSGNIGNFYVTADYVTVCECYSSLSDQNGFDCASTASYVSFIDCISSYPTLGGFRGNEIPSIRLVNCSSRNSGSSGFSYLHNLSNCYAHNAGESGFSNCNNLSNCLAYNASDDGFVACNNLSGCVADGNNNSMYGFHSCNGLSSCRASDCTHGFGNSNRISSCESSNNDSCGFFFCALINATAAEYNTGYGFRLSGTISSSYAVGNGTNWSECSAVDPDSCASYTTP